MEYLILGAFVLGVTAFLISVAFNIYLLDEVSFKGKMNEALIAENAMLRERLNADKAPRK